MNRSHLARYKNGARNCKAVFPLALWEFPQWELEGSKWNSAVRGICGTHDQTWQVRYNQWQVGNNRIMRRCKRPASRMLFLNFLQWISLKYIWLIVFGSIIDQHYETTCQFSFSINFRYINISFNFPGRKAGIFFLILVHHWVTWFAPPPPPAQNCESSLVCYICLCGPSTQEEVNSLHGEVMENCPSQSIIHTYHQKVVPNYSRLLLSHIHLWGRIYFRGKYRTLEEAVT